MIQNRDEPTQERRYKILESSFNNRRRRIESPRSFSNILINFKYYSFKRVYQIHETGDRRSIHKKI